VRMILGCAMAVCALFLSACSGKLIVFHPTETNPASGAALRGTVRGGQNPIAGSSVYLFAVGTGGYGATADSLLTSAAETTKDINGRYYVTTAADGSFAMTGDYACPAANPEVYLYSVGGNTGAGINLSAGLLAGLGPCNNLTPSTFVTLNEVSTVATAFALAGYAVDPTRISSSGSALALQGVTNAFAVISNLESLDTGEALAVTPAGNGVVPQSEIDTLADILEACIDSNGSMVTGAPCNVLFGNAMLPTGVIHPNAKAGGIQPDAKNGAVQTNTATAAINIARNPGSNVAALYGLLSGTGAPFQPSLTQAPNDWTIAITYTGGGLASPDGIAIDGSGNAWLANSGASAISEFQYDGVALSGDAGFSGGGLAHPSSIAVDASGNAWVTSLGGALSEFDPSGSPLSGSGYTGGGMSSPWASAFDGSGNLWIANQANSSLSEFQPGSGWASGSPQTGGGLAQPEGIAVDASGNVWLANYGSGAVGSISEYDPAGGWVSSSGYTGGGLSYPAPIAIGRDGSVWAANASGPGSLTEFTSAGVATDSSPFTGGGLGSPAQIAVDGAGNIWVADSSPNAVSEFNSNGVAISGSNGYQSSGLNSPAGIAIDGSGDVWVANAGAVTEFVGAATPLVTPVAANLMTALGYGQYAVNEP